MSKHFKKKKLELTDEQVIEMIAEEVYQNAVNGQNLIADPFEVYAYHAQAKIFADSNFFKERCLHGYHSLKAANDVFEAQRRQEIKTELI